MNQSYPPKQQRVGVFIDHSNVIHLLIGLRKIDPLWIRWYNPRLLAEQLVGNRQLVFVNFYCAPPPPYLLQEGKRGQRKYWKQMSYYGEITKQPGMILKYSKLSGVKGDLHEKNLDTQLSTDLIISATKNEYDTAILVSNDGDYVSAVEAVQQLGRKVELVYFRGGLSWSLRRVCSIARRVRRSYFQKFPFPINSGNQQ